jgi:hypothetical protein
LYGYTTGHTDDDPDIFAAIVERSSVTATRQTVRSWYRQGIIKAEVPWVMIGNRCQVFEAKKY